MQYLSNGSTVRWEMWHDNDIDPMNFTVPVNALRKNYKNKNWLQFLFAVKAAVFITTHIKIMFANSKHISQLLHL